MTYEIKERLLNGLETAGYVLLNGENGAEKVLKTSDVMKLAEAGMVQGASVVKAGGEKYLDIEGYGKIPVVRKLKNDSLEIVYRVIKDNKCVAYMCRDLNGKNYRLPVESVWEMAYSGRIKNAEASVFKGTKVLKGKGTSLSEFPTIEG